jgi:hypothetical protein
VAISELVGAGNRNWSTWGPGLRPWSSSWAVADPTAKRSGPGLCLCSPSGCRAGPPGVDLYPEHLHQRCGRRWGGGVSEP